VSQNLNDRQSHHASWEQLRAIGKKLKPKHLTLKKYEIVHALAAKYNFQSYLELCTPTTGNYFHKIDRSKFKKSIRLMYNCPAEFDDGLPIDYRVSGLDIAPMSKAALGTKNSFDVCLVDSWHTYDHSLRDLKYAYELLTDGGALVVHDCLPPSLELASPDFKSGPWVGLSYKAYVDFVLENGLTDYFTVDTDYGCGIIYKNRRQPFADQSQNFGLRKNLAREQLAKAGRDYAKIYWVIIENKTPLLNLISVNEFLKKFGDTFDVPRRIFLWLSSPTLARLNLARWGQKGC